MHLLGTALTAAAGLLAAGCGQQTGTTAKQEGSAYDGCTLANVQRAGPVIARADVDGDGKADEIRLTGPDASHCAGSLVATTSAGVVGTRVQDLDLVVGSARVVDLTGDGGDLVLLEAQPHPRDGAQSHLFGYGNDELTEVTVDGKPLLPFVATDGGGSPMSATCTDDGGIEVVTAITHEPPGIVLAWDVRRTTYAIEDGTARQNGTPTVEEAVVDPLLRKEEPELFTGKLLTDCAR